MAITLTGNKVTGTITTTGTTSFTDSGASFASTLADDARMVWLFRSGDPIGMARLKEVTSSTVLTFDSPFFDYDGDEVTQNTGDTYYVSQTASEVATTGWAVSGNVVTITDQVLFGTSASKTGLFLHCEDTRFQVNYGVSDFVSPLLFQGGCCTFGNALSLKNRNTSTPCYMHWSGPTFGNFHSINKDEASVLHFGTVFSTDGAPARIGGGSPSENNTNGFWHVFVNCVAENFDIVSPSGGAVWDARPNFQRVINLTSVGNKTYLLNLRWGDGYIEGGVFKSYGAALAPFGSGVTGTYEVGAADGERLSIFECPDNFIWRAGGALGADPQTVNFTNLLVSQDNKLARDNTGSPYLTNATLNFKYKNFYSGLDEDTKIYIKDTDETLVDSQTIDSTGKSDSIVLTYQTRTFPTTSTTDDTFYNPWSGGMIAYTRSIVPISINVEDEDLAGQTVKNVSFGGPIAQSDDLSITETNIATVSAYTTLDNEKELYDYGKWHLYDNYAGETETFCTKEGAQVNIGSKSLTFDGTASQTLSCNGDYTEGIVKTSLFTGGVVTSGSVTVRNGALLDGGVFDCDVNWENASGTALSAVTVNGALDFNTSGTFTLEDGCSISEVTNSSTSGVTLQLLNGSEVTTNTGPNITLETLKDFSITNIVDGTRLQVYNTTLSAECCNFIVSGTSYEGTYVDGEDFNLGDEVRVRMAYVSGAVADIPVEQTTIVGSAGWSILGAQLTNEVYEEYGVDGSTITEFSFDGSNIEVDINDSDNTTVIQRLGAWYHYYLTTEDGIRNLFGAIDWETLNQIKIETAKVDLKLDNTKATPLLLKGGRLYRDDDTTIIASTSNSIQVDYSPVYIAETGVSGLTPEESTKLLSLDTTNLDATVSSRSTFDHTTDEVTTDSESREASKAKATIAL